MRKVEYCLRFNVISIKDDINLKLYDKSRHKKYLIGISKQSNK